jgi:hypothetical protein
MGCDIIRTSKMKNKVKASDFLEWYFSDSEDAESIGNRAIESLECDGTFTIDVQTLYDECGYIPQHICVNKKGDEDYDPSEVELIQDLGVRSDKNADHIMSLLEDYDGDGCVTDDLLAYMRSHLQKGGDQ